MGWNPALSGMRAAASLRAVVSSITAPAPDRSPTCTTTSGRRRSTASPLAAIAPAKVTGRSSRVRSALPSTSPMVSGRNRTASQEALDAAPSKGSKPVM